MINSVNTLEFLKPKLITMDKFNSTTTTTKLLPLSTPILPSPSSLTQTRTFVTFGNNLHHHNKTSTIDMNTKQNKGQQQQTISGEIHYQQKEERVKVQHLENHSKLQNNNCWNNFRTLCNNLNASLPGVNSERRQHVANYCQINNDNVVVDVINLEQESGIARTTTSTETTPITKNIQNKSAFKLDLNQIKYHNNTIYINNKNNNNNIIRNALTRTEINISNIDQFYLKQYHHKQTPETPNLYVETGTAIVPPQRTEDQNNAYRHIESVHNYAKLKSYEDDDNDDHSPHGSRHSSSYLDEDDDEDDEDDDEEDNDDEIDEEYANGDISYDERRLKLGNEAAYADDLDADYENIFSRQRHRRLQKLSTSSDGALFAKVYNCRRANVDLQKPKKFINHHHHISVPQTKNINDDDDEEETHIDVDVETVESQSPAIPVAESLNASHRHIADDSNAAVKPDHHARRPMNAFLIFCKRHRAIVKERYKNLENRAITKILGDWWASLDTNDKKCFINLAQQNKDAFFSANPDFKWYKLPAPPLRNLTPRPAVNGIGQDYQDEKNNNVLETISNTTHSVSHNNNNNSNYFKLADEAQMGDLSQLMQEKSKVTGQQCVADLQQVLGETSQFMSAHITGMSETLVENVRGLKRRFYNENSFSSNSSEEDSMEPKKKSARSCKGKRYQELINSGQIVTAIKKSKSSTRLSGFTSGEAAVKHEINTKQQSFTNLNNNDSNFTNNNVCQKRSVSESDNMMSYVLNGFDLEERIKELPALDLDDYLQRKRNTKKKKKFTANGKKRGQRSNNNNSTSNNSVKNNNANNSPQAREQQIPNATTHSNEKQLYQQSKIAVGSQKRKARKESITRRDISVIEQEIAPLLPLTINGCCYFQEAPTAPMKYIKPLEKDTKISETSSSIIPLQQYPTTATTQTSSTTSVDILINNTNANIISNNHNNNNNNNNNSNNDSNILNDNILSSSTSDLLILAEVAANRTELKN